MEKEKFDRVVAINERLNVLNTVLKEIYPKNEHKLTYVDKDNRTVPNYIMKHIGNLLDEHDEMIREEIQREIANLHKEIQEL